MRLRRAARISLASLLCGVLIAVLLSGPANVAETWLGLADDSSQPVRTGAPYVNSDDLVIHVALRPFGDRWRIVPAKSLWVQGTAAFGSPQINLPEWLHPFEKDNDRRIAGPARTIISAGWPFRAFQAVEWPGPIRFNGAAAYFETSRTGAWYVGEARRPTASDIPLVIPYTPIWSGLLADVAIWTVASALAFLGFTGLRAANRRRRNRCPHCNYSNAGLVPEAPCPECGRATGPTHRA